MVDTILIAGALAQKPRFGGHAWFVLHYLLGFRRLGWNVVFLDRLDRAACLDDAGRPCAIENSVHLKYFIRVMDAFSLHGSFSLDYNNGERYIGLPRQRVLEYAGSCAFLLNIMGFLTDEEILARSPKRVFLDIDPGFPQMWHDLGLHNMFRGHDYFVTIGENIGRADCQIPTCGLEWITTRQPIVLEYWLRRDGNSRDVFTSVASWRGAYGPVEYGAKKYGLRVHEFRKFVQLPQLTGCQFEMALDIHPAETADLGLLTAHGWSLADPRVVAGDPWAYRNYIWQSKGEFSVAKNMYVQSNSGWFSDRTICYLASGRPALVQDTGFNDNYPVGEGLLTFTTVEQAAAGIEELSRNPRRHGRIARLIAEEYFDSDKVLQRLLGALGIA